MSREENESQKGSNPAKTPNRPSKRKQWSEESMIGAMQAVVDGSSISGPAQIYNVDETGLAYEHRPQKVVTLKGKKK